MPAPVSFRACWLAETLRLREAHWGPVPDTAELRRVRAMPGDDTQKIVLRAQLLGAREGLDQTLRRSALAARWTLLAMLLLAAATGWATALGALGDGSRPVNLALALAAMLGLHGLTFVLWLLATVSRAHDAAGWLGQAWLAMVRKLARGPDAGLAPAALAQLLGRQGALRWSLGAVSHALWLTALLSLLITLLVLLSARRYTFIWETTLLAPDAFVTLAQTLGWLPGLLGFALPAPDIVRASDGLQSLPASAQALWSSWLLGCVLVYGLMPRLLALAVCLLQALRRLRPLIIDTGLPGYAHLAGQLHPPVLTPVDAPAAPASGRLPLGTGNVHQAVRACIAALDWPADTPWPVAPLPSGVLDAGIIDGRASRGLLQEQLLAQPPGKLLIVCDGTQTPDRGTLRYIAELTHLAGSTHVAPVAPDGGRHAATRHAVWRHALLEAGMGAEQIHDLPAPALAWLQEPA